jgi:hypothetical protein
LQRRVSGFIEIKADSHNTPAGHPQARRKSVPEENGKRREEEFLSEPWEEDGTGRRQQIQTGGFTPFSDRRRHLESMRINVLVG